MARRRSRGTGYLGTDKGLRELRPRLGLDNVARSTSDEAHNRRKPRLLSTGTAELENNIALNSKLPDDEISSAKIAGLDTGKLIGTVGSAKLPNNTIYGSYNGNPGKLGLNDIGGVPDFSKFVKDDALKAFVTTRQVKNMIEAATRKKK